MPGVNTVLPTGYRKKYTVRSPHSTPGTTVYLDARGRLGRSPRRPVYLVGASAGLLLVHGARSVSAGAAALQLV